MENKFLKISIEKIDLSKRLFNICKRENIKTLYDLFSLGEEELLKLKGFGKKTLEEIRKLKKNYGYPQEEINKIKSRSGMVFEISTRLYSICKQQGIDFIEDLIELNDKQISSFKHIGRKVLDELNELKIKLTKEKCKFYNLNIHKFLNLKIKDFEISVRLANVLENLNIFSVRDVVYKKITPEKIMNYRNVGKKTYLEYYELYTNILNKISNEINNSNLTDFKLYIQNDLKLNIDKKMNNNDNKIKNILRLIDEIDDNKEIEFNNLMLPGVVKNFLKEKNINDSENLKRYLINNHNEYFNNDILEILERLISDMKDKKYFRNYLPNGKQFFPIWIDFFVSRLNDRDQFIFKLRFAVFGEKCTLEEIAQKVSVTRERVRQLVKAILIKFKKQFGIFLGDLEDYLMFLVVENFNPIDENILKKIINDWDYNKLNYILNFPLSSYLLFLHEIFPSILIKVNQRILRIKFIDEDITRREKIFNYFKFNLPIEFDIDDLNSFLFSKFNINGYDFLKIILSSKNFKVKIDDKVNVFLKNYTFNDAVNIIFNSFQEPMTLQEFKKKTQIYLKQNFNITENEYIRLRLNNNPGVVRIDNNLFVNKNYLKKIFLNKQKFVNKCYSDLRRRGIPTAVYDLYKDISELEINFIPENPNFIIDAVLSTDKRFIKLGRLLYGLKEWGKIEQIKLADLAYSYLNKVKHPLPYKEISNYLNTKRSVYEVTVNRILQVDERFKNYTPGWYGLAEKHAENIVYLLRHAPYLDQLVYSLKPNTELNKVISLLDLEDLVSLQDLECFLSVDPRILIIEKNGTKILYHKNWPIRKYVNYILQKSKKPLNIQEIQWKLNEEFEKVISFPLKEIRYVISTMQNLSRDDDKFSLNSELLYSSSLKENIIYFVKNFMDKTDTLYDLEEMYDFFKNFYSEIDGDFSYQMFKASFSSYFKNEFLQIASDIFRRVK